MVLGWKLGLGRLSVHFARSRLRCGTRRFGIIRRLETAGAAAGHFRRLGFPFLTEEPFNSDGKLDLFVGDQVTFVSPADNITETEFQKRFAEWNKSITEAAQELNSPGQDQKKQQEAQRRYQSLYNRREEFMKEDRTGFVWLYLRK